MPTFNPGDIVQAKSGGPVMMVEANRGDNRYTLTWFENDRARSIVLPGDLIRLVEKPASDMAAAVDEAYRLPKAVVELERRVFEVERKVVVRGYDTRPMYEAHEQKIKALEARLARLEQGEDTTKEF